MAYGKSSNQNALYFNLRQKKGNKNVPPFFEVTKKDRDGYKTLDECTFIEGDIVGLRFKEFEYQEDTLRSVALTLEDKTEGERYIVSIPFVMVGRSIFNSILSLKTFEKIKIDLWSSKDGYAKASVYQNGDRLSWAFEIKDLPAPEEVTFKGKVQRDYTETDNFIQERLQEKFEGLVSERSTSESSSNQEESDTNDGFEGEDDDVPF